MATFYVLYDEFTRTYIRAGRKFGITNSPNAAKHFTSIWSVKMFICHHQSECFSSFMIKRIVLQ